MIVVDADDEQVLGVRETNWCFQGIAYVLHLRIPNKPQTITKAESEKSIETPNKPQIPAKKRRKDIKYKKYWNTQPEKVTESKPTTILKGKMLLVNNFRKLCFQFWRTKPVKEKKSLQIFYFPSIDLDDCQISLVHAFLL